jgi:hypothetical protein
MDAGDAADAATAADAHDAATDAADTSPPACVTAAPSHVCGLAPQCGCATNATCEVFGASGETRCTVAGTFGSGQGCVSTASCKVGLACVDGICRPYCAAVDAGCPSDAGSVCVQASVDGVHATPNDVTCELNCSLITSAGCNVGGLLPTMCVLDDTTNQTDCMQIPADAGAANVACPTGNCGPGLVCANNVCHPWCRVGQSDCGDAGTCSGFVTAVVVRGVEYGACN